MNDKFINTLNSEDEPIARKLNQVAEQTQAGSQFAAGLEERLRSAHKPRTGWFSMRFSQVSPVLGWVAVLAVLALVLSWSIRSLIPAPQPAIYSTPTMPSISTVTPEANRSTATPVTQDGGYDWRQTRLFLAAPLPESPTEVTVSTLKEEEPASLETVAALADQFDIQGNVFQVPGKSPDITAYMVSDGRQRLYVETNIKYDYYADYGTYSYMSGSNAITEEQAASLIDAFLKSHGLNFEYRLENAHINPGMYYVLPVSPEGLPVYHDYNIPARLEVTLDESGQVIRMSSYQVGFEPVGKYGIRTAEEAFQQILAGSETVQNGTMEITRSAGISEAGFWSRSYPDNETITIYGLPAFYPPAQPGGDPFFGIGQFTAFGNTAGIENADSSAYIEATGQFVTENGIRSFNIDTWKASDAEEFYQSGSLSRVADQIILTADDGSRKYVIEDAPSDLPLNTPIPDSYLAVHGFLKDGQLNWDTIQYYPAGSGGGGGGGGTGFYKLNLSGTPVPFPSPTAQTASSAGPIEYVVKEGDTCGGIATIYNVSIQSIISANNLSENCTIAVGDVLKIPGDSSSPSIVGQRIEAVRGIFMVTIYKQADESQRLEYSLYPKPDEAPFFFATLEGNEVQKLEAYHNRPVDIWGTVTAVDQNGMPVIRLERYEIPYPDLEFQLLTGRQKVAELGGELVVFFTTSDGTSYVQLTSNGFPDTTILGEEGGDVILEILAIPGDTYREYPALRVFSGAMAENPKDGQPAQFTLTADKPNIVEESLQPGMENYVPPTLTIEKVELVYYVPDPRARRQTDDSDPQYLQPAWRFYGHYSDGSELEFLVQALKEEFLLPELEPYTGPG